MKIKANNTIRELKERQKIYVFGENACSYQVWRWTNDLLRMFIPIDFDSDIKSWSTNDSTNNHLLHGFFETVANLDGSVVRPEYVDTTLGITNIYRVAGGITIDFYAPGTIQGGQYIIQNLLTIELY